MHHFAVCAIYQVYYVTRYAVM